MHAIKEQTKELEGNEREKNMMKRSVHVLPKDRCHLVGRGGEVLRCLQELYGDVSVSVPPPEDGETNYVTLEGPIE